MCSTYATSFVHLLYAVLIMLVIGSSQARSQWSTSPAVDDTISKTGTYPRLVSDGSGGTIIAWQSGNSIRAQRISGAGVCLWEAGGIIVDSSGTQFSRLNIVDDGQAGALVTWSKSVTSHQVWIAHLTNAGKVIWKKTTGSSPSAMNPVIARDGMGGAFVAYREQSGSLYRTYVQRFYQDGFPPWPPVQADSNRALFEYPVITEDGTGGAIVAKSLATHYIILARIGPNGNRHWSLGGVPLILMSGTNLQIVSNGMGGAFLAWQTVTTGPGGASLIGAAHVDSTGLRAWAGSLVTGGRYGNFLGLQENPSVAFDGKDGIVIVWQQTEDSKSPSAVYAQRIDTAGVQWWGDIGVPISILTSAADQTIPQVIADDEGNVLVTWFENGIYAQRLGRMGNPLWRWMAAPSRVEVNRVLMTRKNVQEIRMIPDGSGGAIATFGGVSAKRVLASGRLGDPSPKIVALNDVANDQGGKVRMRWNRSWYDTTGVPAAVTMYGVWRKIQGSSTPFLTMKGAPLFRSTSSMAGLAMTMNDTLAINYDFVGTVPAIQSPSYSYIAPTLADSTAGNSAVTNFVVTAHTTNPGVYFISFPDSGYSVDNMPPLAPINPSVRPGPASSWTISWKPPSGELGDFKNYVIYRASSTDSIVDPANKLADVMDTVYVDANIQPGSMYSYGITSIDYSGNESTPAIVTITTTDVGSAQSALPTRIELRQNYPNPFNPSTSIRYALPLRSHVTLTVFNTLGQQVATLVDSEVDAGYHEARFDATGLASGVYLYQFQAGEFAETKKFILMK